MQSAHHAASARSPVLQLVAESCGGRDLWAKYAPTMAKNVQKTCSTGMMKRPSKSSRAVFMRCSLQAPRQHGSSQTPAMGAGGQFQPSLSTHQKMVSVIHMTRQSQVKKYPNWLLPLRVAVRSADRHLACSTLCGRASHSGGRQHMPGSQLSMR